MKVKMKIKQTTRREYLFLLTATTAAAIFSVAFLGVVDVVNSFSNTNNHHQYHNDEATTVVPIKKFGGCREE